MPYNYAKLLGRIGASVLMGLFKKRCHTNGFSDFRVTNFLSIYFTFSKVAEKIQLPLAFVDTKYSILMKTTY